MPLVVINYKAGRLPEDLIRSLALEIPDIVASALSVEENPEARLGPEDIEVRVQESGKMDVNAKDLEIVIWANSYPERLLNFAERKDMILVDIRAFLADYDSNPSGFVWVLIQPGAFGEL